MEIKERIQQFLDTRGIKTAPFEKEVGLSNGYWRKTKSVSAKCVEDILRAYPELSAEWVFRGVGHMYRENMVLDDKVKSMGEAYYDNLKEEMESLKLHMEMLESKIG